MLSEKQVSAVEETAAELQRRRANKPAGPAVSKTKPRPRPAAPSEADADRAWVRENLRLKGNEPYNDIANILRVLERHEAFKGRFRYNETLRKVLDKGTVMLDWRVSELVAIIQDRFLPEAGFDDVNRALVVHANRVIQKK